MEEEACKENKGNVELIINRITGFFLLLIFIYLYIYIYNIIYNNKNRLRLFGY
jgi:hypothetical protein